MAEKGPDQIAREIDKAMSEEAQKFSKDELVALGHEALDIIVLRTKAGKDADLNPFVGYTASYTQQREKAGLSSRPDLARTGDMLGAIGPEARSGEVALRFMSAGANIKAIAHNEGVDKQVSVKLHRREVRYNSKTGQRVSAKSKSKYATTRTENVGTFQRHQHTPKREFFDIRHPKETDALEEAIGQQILGHFEKAFK